MPEVPKVDEFGFVLLAGVLFIFILGIAWTTPSESPPIVRESSFEITAAPGEKTTFDFTVSGEPHLTAINLTAGGEIEEWISFSKNNFDAGDSTTVTVTLKIPKDTEEKVYNGRVYVEGEGGTDSFSINVDVMGEGRGFSSRPISQDEFPSYFTVSYYEGIDILDSKNDFRVSKSYFSGRSLNLLGLMSEERLLIVERANLRLLVRDTNSLGKLIVEINDNEIYKRKVGVGEFLIPIDKDYLEKSNVITISSGGPGAAFWANSYYEVSQAEFIVEYKGAFIQTFNITLTDKEVENFKNFNLFYLVKGYSGPLPLMMIKINNQIIYWDNPPLVMFDKDLDEDMFGNPLYLEEGANTITFLFEENAEYTIGDALLTVEYYE